MRYQEVSHFAPPQHSFTDRRAALEKKGYPSIYVHHMFSAEIEVFKQAFIERNFHPPVLFWDVQDFLCESATKATTAYGVEKDIPTDIDILVTGFVCKDLSRMNSNGKTLEDEGESGDTWRAVYTYAKRFRPMIVLLENIKGQRPTWVDIVSQWAKIRYDAAWVLCD
jgi:site-specific DNA-cytosine methylase